MPQKQPYQIRDVKAVTFERFIVSDDGESVIFLVKDPAGNTGHIAINWLQLGITAQLLNQGGEKAAERRKELGKSDLFTGGGAAQLVSGYQVSEIPGQKLKILSLTSVAGFRSDFAIPTDTVDQLGRRLSRGIAEELLSDASKSTLKPN